MGRQLLTEIDRTAGWPDFLKNKKEAVGNKKDFRPIVIEMFEKDSANALKKVVSNNPLVNIVDNYDEQLAELFLSENAQLYRAKKNVQQSSIREHLKDHYGGIEAWKMGSWVYYPWSGNLVHVLEEEQFLKLRTVRNKNIISADEQAKFAEILVGCAGMSVGSSAALAIVLEGGSKKLKLSDSAVISGSNLNRVLTGVADVGLEKATIVARKLYEMNPYMEINKLEESLRASTIKNFFEYPWPLNVVVDEIDDLEMKIRLRIEAKKRRIPVLMATDLSDDVMLDVERYDIEPNLPLFHGLVPGIEHVLDRKDMTQRQWLKYATQIIDSKNVPISLQKSLLQVGSVLPTQPQLGGTAMMAGAIIAFAIRKIALGEKLKSGRTKVSLDDEFIEGATSFQSRRKHKKHTKQLERALSSIE